MDRKFETTRWSVVQAAADSHHPAYREALAELCQTYWPAVYAYVRQRGHDLDDAQELTQGYFAQLLGKKSLKAEDPDRGRFRSFVLASVKHYMANEWHRAQRMKRGGDATTLQLDFDSAESMLGQQGIQRLTPEGIFDRRWAISLLRRTMERLEAEMIQAGKGERFRRLKPFLVDDADGTPYTELARELESSEGAVKATVHRLRRKFGRLLREEVSQTLTDPALLDREMAHLASVLSACP